MKKKLVSVVTAMVLTLVMGTTALAANTGSPSPVTDDDSKQTTTDDDSKQTTSTEITAKTSDGTVVTVEEDVYVDATEAAAKKLDEYKNVDDKPAYIKKLFEEVTKYTASTDSKNAPELVYSFSLKLSSIPKDGAKITIAVKDVKASENGQYFMLHLTSEGNWEYIETTVGDGTLTGTFKSLSPVFVIKAPDAKAPATATTTATTTAATTTTTAPKTGEFAGVQVAGMLALISAAGIVVYTRRKKVVY